MSNIELEMCKISEKLWSNPELALMEYKAAELVSGWLKNNGFSVKENLCNIPTAFKAVYGEGKPNIGFLLEYDALPGLSNDRTVYQCSLGQKAGHGCLHNHIAPANGGAAIMVKDYLEALKASGKKVSGTITVVGCPAEEILYGKVALLGLGAFNEIDILLTSHADYQNAAMSRPTLSALGTEFLFTGTAGHTGIAREGNALYALESFVQIIQKFQSYNRNSVRIEHAIRNGGIAPNINTDKASVWLNLRATDYEQMIVVYNKIRQAAVAVESMQDVHVKEGFIAATRGYLPNDTLADVLYQKMIREDTDIYTEDEKVLLKKIAKGITGEEKSDLQIDLTPKLIKEGIEDYSQDDGEVSWRIPLGRVNWALPTFIPLHHWAATAVAGMELSYKGMILAKRVLGKAAIQIFEQPEIVDKAKRELKERTRNTVVKPPMYNPDKDFAVKAEDFWEDAWI